jgi:hypothetical protein
MKSKIKEIISLRDMNQFHFFRLRATSGDVHRFSYFYCNTHNMFRPNWQYSFVKVVVEVTTIAAGSLQVGIVLQ